jgi:deoxyribodipyrimidine photolyase
VEWLHDSSLAPPQQNYPRPIVNHAEARDRAMAAYRELRARSA